MIELPPLHPIFVNFTAALLPTSLVCDAVGRLAKRESLTHAGWWAVAVAGAVTPLTVITGWVWYFGQHADGPPDRTMLVHQWLGTSTALLIPALALWRLKAFRVGRSASPIYLAAALVVLLALVIQGHLGGVMSFGAGGDGDEGTPAPQTAGESAHHEHQH